MDGFSVTVVVELLAEEDGVFEALELVSDEPDEPPDELPAALLPAPATVPPPDCPSACIFRAAFFAAFWAAAFWAVALSAAALPLDALEEAVLVAVEEATTVRVAVPVLPPTSPVRASTWHRMVVFDALSIVPVSTTVIAKGATITSRVSKLTGGDCHMR